jgi:hypothetical protein
MPHKNGSAISLNDAADLAVTQHPGVPSPQPGADSPTESSMTRPTSNETDNAGKLPIFTKNYKEAERLEGA